jgi:hypothetical protein
MPTCSSGRAVDMPQPLNMPASTGFRTTLTERAAWWVLGLHAVSIGLQVVPWYHPAYRWPVQLAHTVLLLGSALAMVLVLLPAFVRRRQWRRLLAGLSAGILLTAGTHQVHAWRVAWTDRMLQARHCNASAQNGGARVLGDLVQSGGLGEGHAREYVNRTHCLIVACQEEVFQCPRPPSKENLRQP